MTERFVLGIDIGGTNIRMAMVSADLQIYYPFSTRVNALQIGEFMENLESLIREYLGNLGRDYELCGIAVGIPGIISNEGIILSCPNITDMEGLDLGRELRERFAIPAFVEKDTNFILYGEYQRFKDRGISTLCGFYVGTGFGCSFILGGQLYRGTRGFAGELGHIPMKGRNQECNCGNEGCLELYGAGRALASYAQNSGVEVATLFSAFDQNRTFLADFLDNVAIGVATVVNLLDPELIVLGGGVLSMPDFPYEELARLVKARFRTASQVDDLEFVRSESGTYGGCVGGGAYCFEKLRQGEVK